MNKLKKARAIIISHIWFLQLMTMNDLPALKLRQTGSAANDY